MTQPAVGIIMGSQSDLNVMSGAAQILEEFEIAFELTIVSAHRTPDRMFAYAREARPRGLRVIIAGAGGAAHLPGMVAALTSLPVIGVPVKSANSLDGWDSILSILQMPGGIPVATVALNQSKNAGLLAARILGAGQPEILDRMEAFLQRQREQVEASVREVAERDYREFL
jgi:5-(carboxyamino)imidazole ribonucleotide mutase